MLSGVSMLCCAASAWPCLQLLSAVQALKLNGSLLGCHRLRVTPSKTAIVPVKSDFLPRTDLERALCARTVYVANIDKKVDKEDVLAYFEKFCGEACKPDAVPHQAVVIPAQSSLCQLAFLNSSACDDARCLLP